MSAARNVIIGLGAGIAIVAGSLQFTEKRCCEVPGRPGFFEAYIDPVGVPTICAGITRGVYIGMVVSQAECETLEREATAEHAMGVAACIPSLPHQPAGVQGGLIDLGYNAGIGNVCKSSIPRKVAKGDNAAACYAIETFDKAGGVSCRTGTICPGVMCRRSWERAHCDGDNPPAFDVYQRTVCPKLRAEGWPIRPARRDPVSAVAPVPGSHRLRSRPFRGNSHVPVPRLGGSRRWVKA